MKKYFLILILSISYFSSFAYGKVNVVATIPDIGALVQAVGGDLINVDVIAKGTQDPHYLEPKPSYMVKVSHADLLVCDGLALEIGWLPSLIQGGRNPKVNPGTKGYLDLGVYADPTGVIHGGVSRANGDVHPDGNPHYTLDPIRMGKLALVVADRLGDLDEAHKTQFMDNAKKFQKTMEEKTKEWQARIKKSGVKKVITYHEDMSYFLNRFGLEAAGYLEPKPGIPPTVQHTLEIINIVKKEKVPLIMVENYFDTKGADRIKEGSPSTRVAIIGVSVGSKPELKTNADVFEQLVKTIEGK